MNDLENAIKHMHNQFDSPTIRVAKEVQKRMDMFQSPQLRAFLETSRKLQDFVPPAIRAIIETQEHFRLNINPQFQTPLEHSSGIKEMLDQRHTGLAKITADLAGISKWTSSIDTPSSVFTQVTAFNKMIQQVTWPIQELKSYQNHFNKLQGLSINTPIAVAMLDLAFWKRFDYTLIDDTETEPETQVILLDEGSRIKRIIEEIYHNNHRLYTLEPADFEDMIAELLRFQQFEVEMTKRTRDGGYDLIAIKNAGEFPVRFLVECKRFAKKRKIGVGIVRGFRDVINTYGANKGIIITSSYFSTDAEKDRQKNKPYLLDFRDHDDVIGWVNKYVK